MRKNCTHELSERETACADGACPICLKEELAKAQAESAGLAAANHELFDELRRHVEGCECNLTPHFSSTAANALRDLLGPTVELEEAAAERCFASQCDLRAELRLDAARLRAAMENK